MNPDIAYWTLSEIRLGTSPVKTRTKPRMGCPTRQGQRYIEVGVARLIQIINCLDHITSIDHEIIEPYISLYYF